MRPATNPSPTVTTGRDIRSVGAVLSAPQFAFYDPNSLTFPEAMLPPVPEGPANCGLQVVVYDHQPKWKRWGFMAGPVRDFFRTQFYDNRTRQT